MKTSHAILAHGILWGIAILAVGFAGGRSVVPIIGGAAGLSLILFVTALTARRETSDN